MKRPPARRPGTIVALLALALVAPPSAQAQFGRNKVQYRGRDFRIVQTAHFDVYFYEEERTAALDAARMAERIYGRLSRVLDHDFQDRKPILLYASQTDFQGTNVLGGHVDESTGGVTESLKDRVLLPLTGSYAEFEHVLGHELVHSFQFDILRRNAAAATVSPFAFVPSLWFMEGMAEYLSVGRIDPKTVAWMRDATLSGYLRTIDEMDRFNDFLSYRFGQSLWAYIGAKWGDETIGLLLKRAAVLGADRAFERTLGVTLPELSREWHEAVRATYLPEVARLDLIERSARRVTWHTFPRDRGRTPSFIAPALSPDGRELVYLSDLGHDLYSFYDLWLADAETGRPKRRLVASARGGNFESLRYLTSSAEWSPDGDRVALVAKTGGRDAVVVVNVRNGRVERKFVPELNGLQSPTWSPDGRRIAFTGLLGGISDLYVWDLTTDRMDRLTDDRYAQLHPAWSPDGRTLAFATDSGPGTDLERLTFAPLHVALMDLRTGDVRLLPGQQGALAINPVWSPDGGSVAWLSPREGVFDVYLQDIGTGRMRRLTRSVTGAMGEGALLTSPGLSWARRADRLAFSYFEEAGFNVWIADDPAGAAEPSGPPAIAATAASQIGRPRTVAERFELADRNAEADGGPTSFYLTEAGFRRSDYGGDEQARRASEEIERVSVARLLDSAGLALPDTASLLFRDYGVSLSPDVVGRPTIGAQTGGYYGNGVYGGSYVLLSDMLGDHNMLIAGDVQGSFDNARIFASYAYLKNRLNFGVSFEQYPFYRYLGTRFGEVPGRDGRTGEYNLFRRDQYRSVALEAAYPVSPFSRFEFQLEASSIQIDQVLQGVFRPGLQGFSLTLDGPTRAFLRPEVAWVYDNSLSGFTGQIAGRRLRIGAGPALGDLNLADVTVDVRQYVPLPGSLTFAQRFLSFTRANLGSSNDAREFELAWGGPYFLRGYDPGTYSAAECEASTERTDTAFFCPAQSETIGSSVLLLNSELRLPLLNALKDAWLPLNFPPIDAAVFFDVGLAWTPGFSKPVWSRGPEDDIVLTREPLTSYGAGLRMNLFFLLLRLDYTVAPGRDRRFGRGYWSVSFGEMF